jgi:iron-sulfur cluster repair protein YtfE (RIC family)
MAPDTDPGKDWEYDPTLPSLPGDVVESLQFAHTESMQVISLAESLVEASATPSVAEAAARIETFLRKTLPRHVRDEEDSLAPRLAGRHPVVDKAIETMKSEHFIEAAMSARVVGLLGVIRRDVSMLNELRFTLSTAIGELKTLLVRHQAMEESIVFPALRRLLPRQALVDIGVEMTARLA